MNNRMIIGLFVLALPLVLASQAALGAVVASEMGYHPNAPKQAILYGSGTTFEIVASDGTVVHTGTLAAPVGSGGNAVSCQGGQQCVVGDFSSFTQEGTYRVRANGELSQPFTIGPSVLASGANNAMEFFNAALQQGSAYHADLHRAQSPPFPMMADGSFIMEAWMATLPLIRLGSAYNRNPSIFVDQYVVTQTGTQDIREYIGQYVDFIEMLQDYDGDLAVSKGWNNDFQCDTATPSQEKWNDAPEPCMHFVTQSSRYFTASALLAYMEAYPALDSAKQQEVLSRSVSTYAFYKQTYGLGVNDDTAFVGAALFRLYDYTGNDQYLVDAHTARTGVSRNLYSDQTYGNEFYWEEYARHRSAIESAGLAYNYNGADPATFFDERINGDWGGIAETGERAFKIGGTPDFHNSRYMLTEALYAAKAADLAGSARGKEVAQRQVDWLTGMNRIQEGYGDGNLVSQSFIFGIGTNPQRFHTRLLNPEAIEPFTNGKTIIPGWVSGAYDTNGDGKWNHDDSWYSWRFTESTNEMVAESAELFAYLDAVYRGSAPPPPPPPVTPPPTNTTPPGNETPPSQPPGYYYTLGDIPAACIGGAVVADVFDGGRAITCTGDSGSLTAVAYDKPDALSPDYFEMYRRDGIGTGISVCLASTCLSVDGGGYAMSESYPIPTSATPPVIPPVTPPPTNTTPPGNETPPVNETPVTPPVGPPVVTPPVNETPPPVVPPVVPAPMLPEYAAIEEIPSTCADGYILADEFNGGRRIVCGASGKQLVVTAWEKPGLSGRTHFEMYIEGGDGSDLEICLAGTCISGNGYARSTSFPIGGTQ